MELLELNTISDRVIFKRITELVTTLLGCPVSLVSIVEGERQWFLGNTGFGLDETPLDVSFCAVCIADEQAMLVTDALTDPRFRANALVRQAPFIRSYLGVPIRSEDGELLGALCAISTEPNAFYESSIAPLSKLAELVEQNIMLHHRTRQLSRRNAALRESARVFHHAEMAANIGSWRIDIASNMLHWSNQARTIHGLLNRKQVSLSEAIKFYVEEDRALVRANVRAALEQGIPFQLETHIKRRDGALRRIKIMGERIEVDGQPVSIAGIVQDYTEDHLRDLALKHAAEHDRLTGLYNRAEFDRRLIAALAEAKGRPVTVALLDLDGFKDVNDTLGHLAGDQVLASLAARYRQMTGKDVFLARWGGDEFALLFNLAMDLPQIVAFCHELIISTGQFSAAQSNIPVLGATCGIARTNENLGGEELIRRADIALYRGKRDQGVVVCWDERLEAHHAAPKLAIRQLRHALDRGETFAAYQPIFDLETRRPVSVEALLRLPDGAGGVLAASEVFSALLDPVLSRRVSLVMLDEILKDGPQLLELLGPKCRIGLNLSQADLRETGFAEHLLKAVGGSAISPENLTIEVTETMLLSDESGRLRAALHLLDQAGCIIALDDFGTGFSSLSHLRRFPIRKLKIDREFISNIASDKQSRLIIQGIVDMSRSLGLRVVAEGVETAAEEEFLVRIGCAQAQGYRYARPQRLGDLVHHYRSAPSRNAGLTHAA